MTQDRAGRTRIILLAGIGALALAGVVLGLLAFRPAGSAGDLLAEARLTAAQGDYTRAGSMVEEFLASHPDDAAARTFLDTLTRKRNALLLAQSYLDRNEYDRALELVDSLLLENPEDQAARALMDSVVTAKQTAEGARTAAERDALAKQQANLSSSLANLTDTLRDQTRETPVIQASPERQAAEDATAKERERIAKINDLTRQGERELSTGKYTEARSTFEKVLELDAESAVGQSYLGYSIWREAPEDSSAQQRAVQLLTRAAQKDPSLWQPHAYLGQIYEQGNDPTNALREYKEAARLNPKNFDILYSMGKLQYNARQFEDAARSFSAAAVVDPKASKAHFNKGMSYLALQDAPKALQALQDAIAAQPDYGRAYYEMANILWRQGGDGTRAVSALRSAVKVEPSNPTYLRRLGEILSVAGNYREAETAFAQALALDATHAETNYNMAIVKIGLNAPRDAIKYAKAAVDASPSTARYNYQLGLAYEKNGDENEAIRSYTLSIQNDASYLAPLVNLGKLFDDNERYDEALAVLTKASQVAPADFAANNNLGNAYQHKGLYQKAIEHFQIALKASPNAASTRYNLGLAYAELGRDAEAKQTFLEVIRIDPASWDSYLKLARLLIKEGDKTTAKSFLQTLLDKNPRYEKKDEATSLLNQL